MKHIAFNASPFQMIRRFFALPIYPDTSDKSQLVSGLYKVLTANIMIAVIYGLFMIVIGQKASTGLVVIGIALAITYPLLVLIRRNRTRSAIIVFALCFWLLIPAIMFTSGNLPDIVKSLYVPLVSTALLFLGWQASLVSVAITLVYIISIFIGANFSHLPDLFRLTEPEWSLLIAVILVLVFTPLFRIQRKLGSVLRKAQEELVEREKAAVILSESEARFRLISSATSDYTFSSKVDAAGVWVQEYLTGAFEAITGYTPEEYFAHGGWSAMLHPDHQGETAQMLSTMAQNQRFTIETQIVKKSGEVRWIRVYANPVWDDVQNRLVGMNGGVQDITERKLAELALAENEERYRLITSIASDYTFSASVSPDGTIKQQMNTGAFEAITGYTADTYAAVGGWLGIVYPDDMPIHKQNIALLRQNTPATNELRIIRKDGAVRWVRLYLYPLWDQVENYLKGMNGAVLDITERKQIEATLAESEERFRLISSVTSDYTFSAVVNAAGQLEQNQFTGAFEAITGYTPEEYLANGGWNAIVYPDDMTQNAWGTEIIRSNKSLVNELRIIKKGGEVRWVRTYTNLIWDEAQNRVASINGAVQDITERKQAEESLQKSEERFRLISSVTSDYTFSTRVDAAGVWKDDLVTGAFEAMTGYTVEEYMAMGPLGLIHPDDIPRFGQDVSVTTQNKPMTSEVRMIRKNGEVRWIRVYGKPVWDEVNNRLLSVNGAVQDITERKRAEEALQKSEERFRLISSITSDYTFSSVVNAAGQLEQNQFTGAFEAITGYAPEEYMEIGSWNAILHPDDKANYSWGNNKIARGNGSLVNELRIIKKGGEIRWVRVYTNRIWNEAEDRLVGVNGAVQDITERKRIEESLQKSEERFRLIASSMSDFSYSSTLTSAREWGSNLISGAFESITGYTVQEYQTQGGWRLLLHPEDLPKLGSGNALLENNQPVVNEVRLVKKSGEVRWVRIYGKPVWDDVQNRLVGVNGAVQDITERKLAEEALAKREEHFRLITSMMSDYTYVSRLNDKGEFKTELITGAVERITGYTAQEFSDPDNWARLLHPEDRERNDPLMIAALSVNQSASVESRIIRKSGELGWVHIYVSPIWDEAGNRLVGVNGAMRDITERKEADETLANERKLLRAVIDHMPDNIYVKDNEGKFILNNNESMHLLGASRQEDLLGKSEFDFFPPEVAETRNRENHLVMQSGQAQLNVETSNVLPDNSSRWIISSYIPLHNDGGIVIGLVSIQRDITERKQAEEAVRRSEALQRALLDATTDAAFLMSSDETFLTLNKPMAQTMNATVEEMVGQNVFDGLPADVEQARRQRFEEVALTGRPARWEDSRNNQWWFNCIYPVISPANKIEAYAVFIRNTTEEKYLALELQRYATQLETMVEERTTELRRAKEQIEIILNNTRDAIGLAHPNGDIQTRNPAFIKMFGEQVEKWIEGLVWMVSGDDCEPVSTALIDMMQHREPQHIETQIAFGDVDKDIELSFTPVQLADQGSQPGILINAHDITHLKEIERFKTRFVADAVHDLATPITALSTRLYLLKRSPEKLDIHVQALENQVAHFRDMLMDLRTLSQLDRKQVDLEMQMGDVNKLVMKVFDTYEPVALEKQQTLKLILAPNIPEILFDGRQNERVFINLVSNAINYSPPETTIIVETCFDNKEITFSVTDQGIGMNEEEVAHIFERFYRTDKARQTRSSGTGLGLAIVKEIVELHGGSITVRSQPGVGSTFTVRLPIRQ